MYTLTLLLVYRVNKLLTLAIFVQVNFKYLLAGVENSIWHLLETALATRPTLFSIVTTYIVHVCRGMDMRFENSVWLPSLGNCVWLPCLGNSVMAPQSILTAALASLPETDKGSGSKICPKLIICLRLEIFLTKNMCYH